MTTAKEIIIDGVDISKCEHSFKQFDNWIGKDVVSCDCALGFRCEPKENHCKFYMDYLEKQLKAKEQECEELKKGVLERCPNCGEEYLNPVGTELYEENERYKHTLDILEDVCRNLLDDADFRSVAESLLKIIDEAKEGR